ncbi:hypothetical protein AYO44_16875 [Planctomycetaceae bacterium SCGC AG-212-F19]|nr:hypothetical protein AYO44_16875 [Planctomycetaceae bacterium SCGC AG-212-F19]
MGRKPKGRKAMTDAERQRRRRKRLRSEKLKLGRKAERQKKWLKTAGDYIPTPPGITYWEKVTIRTTDGERTLWQPKTRPAAAVEWNDAEDTDVLAVLEATLQEARRRSLPMPQLNS